MNITKSEKNLANGVFLIALLKYWSQSYLRRFFIIQILDQINYGCINNGSFCNFCRLSNHNYFLFSWVPIFYQIWYNSLKRTELQQRSLINDIHFDISTEIEQQKCKYWGHHQYWIECHFTIRFKRLKYPFLTALKNDYFDTNLLKYRSPIHYAPFDTFGAKNY